ncbi:hypothetical protein E4U55_004563 [Claviceps digitariae]|nr:hypothetical protein E4U55_004563 [Claviceps digitariae]
MSAVTAAQAAGFDAIIKVGKDMAYVGTIYGLSTIVEGSFSIGVTVGTGWIAFVAFVVSLLPKIDKHEIKYAFKIGLEGAGYEDGKTPLLGAGGDAPDIRVYDNLGRYMGESHHRFVTCHHGSDNCVSSVYGIKKQPSYALFIGKPNAVCIAAIAVQYPGGDKYGWVGNWAQTCGQPWYYSAVDAQTRNGSIKLDCAWIGSHGYKHGFTTGIRIHFPQFVDGFPGNGNYDQYYCQNNNTALAFYQHKHPRYFDGSNRTEHHHQDKHKRPPHKRAVRLAEKERMRRISYEVSDTMWKRSIQSHVNHHSAKHLCESHTSAGPSLVSMADRLFCHMPEKVLYRFCADVESGACWDHDAHAFDAKGAGAIHVRAAMPNIQFDKPMIWR